MRQGDKFPAGWEPVKGVFGQMVPCGLLTARETARVLRISERTLHALTKSGEIQVVRFGRAVRYDPDVLKQWIEKQMKRTQG
jgi:excisionase family DNA binding protein